MQIEVEDVQRLHLEPGDTLVFKVRRDLTPEQAERIREVAKQALPDHRFLVLTEGIDLQVVEPPPTPVFADPGGRATADH